MKKNIYLVGFMGSGKSTVGRILAEKLDMKFVDIDALIEEQEGLKIKDIFKEKGELYFRNLEKDMINKIVEKKGFVVSTGGGLGADPENMKKMKKTGFVVWLDVPLEEILKRTKEDLDIRPLLNQPLDQIKQLYEKRKKVYSMADLHLKAYDKSPEEIAQEIIKNWKSIQE